MNTDFITILFVMLIATVPMALSVWMPELIDDWRRKKELEKK